MIVELCISANVRAYHPDGSRDESKWVEDYYVRARSKKRCVELLNEHLRRNCSMHFLRNYASRWGDWYEIESRFVEAKEGIWFTKNHWDHHLHPLWVDGVSYGRAK